MERRPGGMLWRNLYLIGLPTMGVSVYLLHEAIWPGEGMFLNLNRSSGAIYGPFNETTPGDFSQVNSLAYWLRFYIPFGIGAALMAIGRYLQIREPVDRHVTYDEMEP